MPDASKNRAPASNACCTLYQPHEVTELQRKQIFLRNPLDSNCNFLAWEPVRR